jgi:hypothetical protein
MPHSQNKGLSARLRVMGLVLVAGLAGWTLIVLWTGEPSEWRLQAHYKVQELAIPRLASGYWKWLTDDRIVVCEWDKSDRFSVVDISRGSRDPLSSLNASLRDFDSWSIGPYSAVSNDVVVFVQDDSGRRDRILAQLGEGGQVIHMTSTNSMRQKQPMLMWPLPDGTGWFEFSEGSTSNRVVRVQVSPKQQLDAWDIPGPIRFLGAVNNQTIAALPGHDPVHNSSVALQLWELGSNGTAKVSCKTIDPKVRGVIGWAWVSPNGKKIVWGSGKSVRRPAFKSSFPFVREEMVRNETIYVSDFEAREFTEIVSVPDDLDQTAWWLPSGKAVSFEFSGEWYRIDVP